MIDFHSHFLPSIDDGSDSVETSLAMLRESRSQGVDLIFATPHFYADEDDPETFLSRRNAAYTLLKRAMAEEDGDYPQILLGAEILYFPGMSDAEELYELRMGDSPLLLIEPPMMPWTNAMLDEVELIGANLHCIPVIAHVDRFMRFLRDDSLFDRLEDRKVLIQVNANFFLRSETSSLALRYLREERIHFIGSDCHNMDERSPNMGPASVVISDAGLAQAQALIDRRLYRFLKETR